MIKTNSKDQTEEPKERFQGSRRFVTIQVDLRSGKMDLELRGDMPIGKLLPLLLRTLGWHLVEDKSPLLYKLVSLKGGKETELQNTDTLITAGVCNGDPLRIITGAPQDRNEFQTDESNSPIKSATDLGSSLTVRIDPTLTRQNHDTIPPRRKRVDVTQPSLVSPQGNIYTLKPPSVWIGRPTKGFRPDINLLELEEDPANPSSSRRHAELFQEGNKNFFLRPRPTLNGTFVNGVEIAHNQNHILKEGDLLRFGDVELTFRLPH